MIESEAPAVAVRRTVSLPVLAVTVVSTALLAGAIAYFALRTSLGRSQAKPAPTAPAIATQIAPTPPAPVPLTNGEIFTLAAPSVVLLQVYDQAGQMIKTGSGFVAASNGTIITNYHVIRGAYSERAVFQSGETVDVLGVLGYSPKQDIAAIRVNAGSLKALSLGNSDAVSVGDRVVALGSPRGLQNTISDGLISALRPGVFQTSAPISPGSSGGPFLDANGKVIGIAVATLQNGQNLNFVLPINGAKPYLTSSTLTKLSDLAEQNTKLIPIVQQTVEIPAHEGREWRIVIDENQMDDAELKGSFESSGGINGKIQVLVQDQGSHQVVYDSLDVSSGQVDVKLRAGVYRLVMSNAASVIFSRKVTADISLSVVE